MTLILIFIIVAIIPCFLLGFLTMFYWAKTPIKPSDTSNRINNIEDVEQ